MFTNRLKGAFKMSSNIVLDVRRVEKNYNTTTQEGKENIYSVLKGISFQVHKGEFISIMGSSGCGKTTLLKIIGMLKELCYIKGKTYRKYMEKILPGYEEQRLHLYFKIII